MDELPATYRRAELLTEYYILSRETEVVDERILREKKKGEVQEPEREHILRWVKEDTEKGPEEYLKKLLENLSAYRIQETQKYLKELIADVIRLSENIGGEYEQYEKYLEDFLKNPVFVGQANLEEWLCQLFYQVKDQLKDGRQTTSARVMGEVVAYIEENYDSCGAFRGIRGGEIWIQCFLFQQAVQQLYREDISRLYESAQAGQSPHSAAGMSGAYDPGDCRQSGIQQFFVFFSGFPQILRSDSFPDPETERTLNKNQPFGPGLLLKQKPGNICATFTKTEEKYAIKSKI